MEVILSKRTSERDGKKHLVRLATVKYLHAALFNFQSKRATKTQNRKLRGGKKVCRFSHAAAVVLLIPLILAQPQTRGTTTSNRTKAREKMPQLKQLSCTQILTTQTRSIFSNIHQDLSTIKSLHHPVCRQHMTCVCVALLWTLVLVSNFTHSPEHITWYAETRRIRAVKVGCTAR